MTKKAIAITVVFVALGVFTYVNFFNKVATEFETACLSAAIPAVAMHQNENEIVDLLKELAQNDVNSQLDQQDREATQPFFSKAIDKELGKIAEYFKNYQEQAHIDSSEISGAVKKAISLLHREPKGFMGKCVSLLKQGKQKCGSIAGDSFENKKCLEPSSEKVTALLKTYNAE